MFLFKQLQLHPVEGIVVGSFSGAPLADPVHGKERDAGIVLSRIPVDSKKDAFQFGFCEVFIEAVRVDEKGFPAAGAGLSGIGLDIKKPYGRSRMAHRTEAVGFEPTDGFPSPDFEYCSVHGR